MEMIRSWLLAWSEDLILGPTLKVTLSLSASQSAKFLTSLRLICTFLSFESDITPKKPQRLQEHTIQYTKANYNQNLSRSYCQTYHPPLEYQTNVI